MSISPMLLAIDLVRLNIDAMDLEELEAHAVKVLDNIGAMNDYINSVVFKSANARRNALNQSRKLCLHMARVRNLINFRNQAAAMMASMHTSGTGYLTPNIPGSGF